jgi:hypothetical protein
MFEELTGELLRDGYAVRFRPGGHSMHPTIRDGEHVTIAPVRANEIKRGDIILYQSPRGPLAHRVMKMEGKLNARLFILRGDACTSCDAPVSASQVLGRAVSVERNGRALRLSRRRLKFVERGALRSLLKAVSLYVSGSLSQ